MANPTAKPNSETMDYSGLALECAQLKVNGTPVLGSQQTAIASLTDSTGGTGNNTLVAISGSGDDSEINNNFADLAAKVNAIIVALEDAGILADS